MLFHYNYFSMGTSNFKENLRSELDFQGITVKELSAGTKIPVATMDCYLRTRSTEPSAENAVKIARALNVSVEYLVLGDETGSVLQQAELSREARELIYRIKSLNIEQCKVILRLLAVFN